MNSSRTTIALLLALTLVGQGWASVRTGGVAAGATSSTSSEMPCHDPEPTAPSCCDPDQGCPDMLSCLAGQAVVPSLVTMVLAAAPSALTPRTPAALHASVRPPTAFRPPIAISA